MREQRPVGSPLQGTQPSPSRVHVHAQEDQRPLRPLARSEDVLGVRLLLGLVRIDEEHRARRDHRAFYGSRVSEITDENVNARRHLLLAWPRAKQGSHLGAARLQRLDDLAPDGTGRANHENGGTLKGCWDMPCNMARGGPPRP